MNTQQNMDERLWDYIDGRLAAEEKPFIEQLIATNNRWKSKYHELLDVHELMSHHLELDQPSMRFTQNVMEEIGKLHITPAAKTYINKRVIWGIGGFFLLTIVINATPIKPANVTAMPAMKDRGRYRKVI